MGLRPADMNEGARTNRSRDRQGAPSGAVRVGDAVVVRRFRRRSATTSDCSTLPGGRGSDWAFIFLHTPVALN